jgi:hypothetical protein
MKVSLEIMFEIIQSMENIISTNHYISKFQTRWPIVIFQIEL